jgi:hypothetical protein
MSRTRNPKEVAMKIRHRICAALLGLVLAGPALAGGQSTASHSAAHIDIAALTAQSDFTVFMRKDVPEELRRAALRRLWVLMQLPVSCDALCYEPHPETELLASRERSAIVAAR